MDRKVKYRCGGVVIVKLSTKSQLYRHLTGMAGTFEVAKQLALYGYNVCLTQRNFPSVDLFVQNPKNMKSVPIQVKALRKPNSGGFFLSPEKTKIPNLIIVFVVLETSIGSPEVYIAEAAEAAKRIRYPPSRKGPGISMEQIRKEDKWLDNWDLIIKKLD